MPIMKNDHYICPKCGSENWKFPNSLKPAEGAINIYTMVNSMYECRDCGYVGTFFVTDNPTYTKAHIKKVHSKQDKLSKLSFIGWLLVLLGLLGIFIAPSLHWAILWMIILFTAAAKCRKK